MLDIALPVLNKEQTKKNVLQALKKYKLYVSSISEEDRKAIEAGHVVAEKKMKRYLYVQEFEKVLENSLNFTEKQIIREGYIEADEHNWIKMSQSLNLSKTPYYKKRDKAFYKLAYVFGIEVEEE
ncbi:ArpU family transcriptional regulator [Bacillus cereus group sp. MG6]|uniref:ArpU family transcriptional regulator n=1 Tax=Bacillus cereus group sp. MG6 TaxID=3040246 RepID=UPI003391DC9E